MRSGSVIADLAVEQGANCTLSEPLKTVVKHGVTIIGELNLPPGMGDAMFALCSFRVGLLVLAVGGP